MHEDIEELIASETLPEKKHHTYYPKKRLRMIARHHFMRLFNRKISTASVIFVERVSYNMSIWVYDRHSCLIFEDGVIAYQTRLRDIALNF